MITVMIFIGTVDQHMAMLHNVMISPAAQGKITTNAVMVKSVIQFSTVMRRASISLTGAVGLLTLMLLNASRAPAALARKIANVLVLKNVFQS